MKEAIILITAGIIILVLGVLGIKKPMLGWKIWIARLLLVKGGEPTDFYYWVQKKLGWLFVVLGICVMIAGGLQLKAIFNKLTVTLDGKEVTLPCRYEDFEKIGYTFVEDDVDEIRGEKLAICYLSDENGKEIRITIENDKKQSRDMEDCTVTCISADMKNAPVIGVEGVFNTNMSKDEITDACKSMAETNLKRDNISIDMSNSFEKYFVDIYYDKPGDDGIIETIRIEYEN